MTRAERNAANKNYPAANAPPISEEQPAGTTGATGVQVVDHDMSWAHEVVCMAHMDKELLSKQGTIFVPSNRVG